MKRLWACLCLCCCLCAAPLWSFAAAPAGNTGTYEVTELWTGDVLTASFRMGMCFAADGKLRGVVLLRSSNGQVDVYHVYGSVQNKTFSATHGSGHKITGRFLPGDDVEVKIRLGNGMRFTTVARRFRDVPLTDDCAPLPETSTHQQD